MKLNCKSKVIKLLILSTIAGIALGRTPLNFNLYTNTETRIDDRITITATQDSGYVLTIETNDDYTAEPDADPFLKIDANGARLTLIQGNNTINDEMTWTFNKDVYLWSMLGNRFNEYLDNSVGLEFTIDTMTYVINGPDLKSANYTDFSDELRDDVIVTANTPITVKTIGDQPNPNAAYSIGVITVMIVPEPSTYALILGGSVFLLFLSKRFRDSKRT